MPTQKSFELAGLSNLSFDIDFEGDFLYIAAINNTSDVQILKLATDLESDPEAVHEPGGALANIICGRNSDRIWLGGDFGIIKYDGIEGSYWAPDSYTTSWNVDTFHLGPGDDQWLLVFTDDSKIWHSYFIANSPVYWLNLNQDTQFDTYAVDRLDTNPAAWVVGCNYFYTSSVAYTPNNGYAFLDVTGQLANLSQVTSVLFL